MFIAVYIRCRNKNVIRLFLSFIKNKNVVVLDRENINLSSGDAYTKLLIVYTFSIKRVRVAILLEKKRNFLCTCRNIGTDAFFLSFKLRIPNSPCYLHYFIWWHVCNFLSLEYFWSTTPIRAPITIEKLRS